MVLPPIDASKSLTTDPITLVGLIFESASGLRRELTPFTKGDIGVSGQAIEVLIRLNRSPGSALRMSDLAAQTGLSRSGLTRALDRLVDAGLCARSNCERDRRGTFALLTDSGRTQVSASIAHHEAEIKAALDGTLTAEEENQLIALLTKVRDRVHPNATKLSSIDACVEQLVSPLHDTAIPT
jgi:DNA-binding MarR family transcriptional regulator